MVCLQRVAAASVRRFWPGSVLQAGRGQRSILKVKPPHGGFFSPAASFNRLDAFRSRRINTGATPAAGGLAVGACRATARWAVGVPVVPVCCWGLRRREGSRGEPGRAALPAPGGARSRRARACGHRVGWEDKSEGASAAKNGGFSAAGAPAGAAGPAQRPCPSVCP